VHAHAELAAQGSALVQAANAGGLAPPKPVAPRAHRPTTNTDWVATGIYAEWLHRLRIRERFPQPDWSIADKWVAKELLRYGTPAPQVAAILRAGSPGFPRRHAHPEDYLSRTLARATLELEATPFSRRAAWLGNL